MYEKEMSVTDLTWFREELRGVSYPFGKPNVLKKRIGQTLRETILIWLQIVLVLNPQAFISAVRS